MAEEMYDRIEKQLEGNSLALAAVAEVLQKMDYRMSEEEEYLLAKEEEEEAEADRESLILDIAHEVATIIKADNGMDVSGDPRPAKSTGKTAANADDSETTVSPTDDIEDQQATIQAMQKNHHDEDDDEDNGDNDTEKGMNYMKAAEIKEQLKEIAEHLREGKATTEDADKLEKIMDPGTLAAGAIGALVGSKVLGKDTEEDEDEETEEKSMQKQIQALQKQVEDYELNMKKSIQTESENRLRKMGFREETSLNAPKMVDPLGVDGTEVLQKGADDADTVDQLTNLSYKELRDLQTNIEQGNTDGVPRELLG